MKKVVIEFNCDSAAFEGTHNLHTEISTILSQLSEMADESLPHETEIGDGNGNIIGYFKFIKE